MKQQLAETRKATDEMKAGRGQWRQVVYGHNSSAFGTEKAMRKGKPWKGREKEETEKANSQQLPYLQV